MKHLKIIIVFLVLYTFVSCLNWDSESDTITGKYNVMWIDLPEKQFICKEYGNSSGYHLLVKPYVFAIGHNDEFIIAKQHPEEDSEDYYHINSKITNYFIIDIRSEREEVLGPFDKPEFDKQRLRLGINEIEFDMQYPEIP